MVFIARVNDVGGLRDWLEAVESRLNEDDIRCDENIFKWAPMFQITSWGNPKANGSLRVIQELVLDKDVYEIISSIHGLDKPYNRASASTLDIPYHHYFLDPEQGKKDLLAYLKRTFDE